MFTRDTMVLWLISVLALRYGRWLGETLSPHTTHTNIDFIHQKQSFWPDVLQPILFPRWKWQARLSLDFRFSLDVKTLIFRTLNNSENSVKPGRNWMAWMSDAKETFLGEASVVRATPLWEMLLVRVTSFHPPNGPTIPPSHRLVSGVAHFTSTRLVIQIIISPLYLRVIADTMLYARNNYMDGKRSLLEVLRK